MAASRSAKKTTKRKTTARATRTAKTPARPPVRQGFISHTELASQDPAATRAWCEEVLGWKFGDPMPTPDGPYHMWQFKGTNTGGGIRGASKPGEPSVVPYVEVKDIHAAVDKAKSAGANEMLAPLEVPGAGGFIAIVQAPGGVPIGFWGPKR